MRNKLTAILLAALMLTGCGSSGESSSPDSSSAAADITARELLADIDNDLLDGRICMGEEKFDSNAEKFYGVGIDSIEDGGIMYNSEGGCADEISAVRFTDQTDGAALLQKRLEDRTATFRDYRPEELDKLENARIFSAGGYDLLVISDDAEALARQLEQKLS